MSAPALLSRYRRFSRLRWLGIALFCLALPIPPTVLATVLLHDARFTWLFPAIGCLGLSLGAFGAANDTALWSLREAAKLGPVPSGALAELDHEREVRPARLLALHDSPKASLVIPLLAGALIGWVSLSMVGMWPR